MRQPSPGACLHGYGMWAAVQGPVPYARHMGALQNIPLCSYPENSTAEIYDGATNLQPSPRQAGSKDSWEEGLSGAGWRHKIQLSPFTLISDCAEGAWSRLPSEQPLLEPGQLPTHSSAHAPSYSSTGHPPQLNPLQQPRHSTPCPVAPWH